MKSNNSSYRKAALKSEVLKQIRYAGPSRFTSIATLVVALSVSLPINASAQHMELAPLYTSSKPLVKTAIDTKKHSPANLSVNLGVNRSDTTATEIVFIDSTVNSLEQYIPRGPLVDVVVLDADKDGVEQISAALSDRRNIDAIHILSHGQPGTLDLGNTSLTEASLNGEHADELQVIANALSEDAEILIYGCNFGADERGMSAVDALAALTGADIAASTDYTGSARLGGDWELERKTNTIETASLALTQSDVLLIDTDGDGIDDSVDPDDDNDGISDLFERVGASASNQTIYINDSSRNLIAVTDINGTPVATTIGQTSEILGDIGMAPDGTLYGVSLSGGAELYIINPATAATTLVGTVGSVSGGLNTLSFDQYGTAYASNEAGAGKVYSFDPANPGARHFGTISPPPGHLVEISSSLRGLPISLGRMAQPPS